MRSVIFAVIAVVLIVAVVAFTRGLGSGGNNPATAQHDGTGGSGTAAPAAGNGSQQATAQNAAQPDELAHLDTLDARLPALKDRHLDDDVDVDVDRQEADALRRRATELRETLTRTDAQQKRGARAWVDSPEQAKKRNDQIQHNISELENRAQQLEDEVAQLRANAPDLGTPDDPQPHRIGRAELDPHAAQIDEDDDNNEDDSDTDVD